MTKDDRNMLIGGSVATAVLLAFGYYAFADDDDEDEPAPGPVPRPGDPRYCDLDGQLYDAVAHPTPASVVDSLEALGYPLTSVTSPEGRLIVQSFQVRARKMGLRGYAGAPEAYIDSIVGACTLRSVEHALQLQQAGMWPDPMNPLP